MADPQPTPAGGNPPPRPGDPIPDGGLDPTQVFAAPPTPPKSAAGGSAGAGQGDDSAVPQDSGPPPPPPGPLPADDQLKAKGYDDEDIRILKEVKDYRFGSITNKLSNEHVVVPAHPETTFDQVKFLTLLRGSISLTRDEKWRIIQAIPKLSQFQIDELQKILEEERQKFNQLSPKHLRHLMQLEKKHSEDWKDLQSLYVQQTAKAEEQNQADAIRKQLGL
jgi:hypothetical protein